MVAQAHVFLFHAQAQQEVLAVILPIVEPVQIGVRLAEELALHLLELPDAENKVARRDLVAEGFADLAHAERQLAARGALDIGVVDKDALRRFRPQIDLILGVFGNAHKRLEHQVELADVGKIFAAAFRAGDAMLANICRHLVEAHAFGVSARVLDELVRAVTGMTVPAVHQRVGKAAHMAGGDPGLRVHQNGGIQANIVFGFLHELLPPGLFDIVFKLDAKRAVIPAVGQAAVDLAARIYKAPVFAQGDDLVHGLCAVFHRDTPFLINDRNNKTWVYCTAGGAVRQGFGLTSRALCHIIF